MSRQGIVPKIHWFRPHSPTIPLESPFTHSLSLSLQAQMLCIFLFQKFHMSIQRKRERQLEHNYCKVHTHRNTHTHLTHSHISLTSLPPSTCSPHKIQVVSLCRVQIQTFSLKKIRCIILDEKKPKIKKIVDLTENIKQKGQMNTK